MELQNAQEAQMNIIKKNIALQMEGVIKDQMLNRLKNQSDFTWNQKFDSKMKFQQAGHLAQYSNADETAQGLVPKDGVLLHPHPLNNQANKEEWET